MVASLPWGLFPGTRHGKRTSNSTTQRAMNQGWLLEPMNRAPACWGLRDRLYIVWYNLMISQQIILPLPSFYPIETDSSFSLLYRK